MRSLILATIALFASVTFAGTLRNQQADTLISADTTKTWSLPSATDTLCGLSSSQTLTNKTINAANNTLTGVLSNPMTTGGDIIYGGSSGTPTRLANGSSGQVLTSSGGTSAPTWATPGGSSSSTDPWWLSNAGVSFGNSSSNLTVTLTQSNGSSAPTSGSPVIFSAPISFGGGTQNYQVTSALSMTIPSGATLGVPVNNQAYYLWIYLINNSGTPDICVSGVNPPTNTGSGQYPTDLVENYFPVTAAISSGATTASTLYCGTAGAGSYPGHLIARAYLQGGILSTSGAWNAIPNLYTLGVVPTRFYATGTYVNTTPLYSPATTMVVSSTGAMSFTIPSSSVTAGAIYQTNGSYWVASATIASATTLVMASLNGNQGTIPATGTLTLISGTGPASISYTARTASQPAASTAGGVVNNVTWIRDGDQIDQWFNYYSTATLTSAAAGTGDYIFGLVYPLSSTAYTTGAGGTYVGGTAQSTGEFAGVTALSQYKIQAYGVAETNAAQVFTVTSAVPYTPAFYNSSYGANYGSVRVLGQYMNTTTTLTASEVPLGSTYIPLGSNIAYNFHVKYVSSLGVYGP
jgi:hypothetical protein